MFETGKVTNAFVPVIDARDDRLIGSDGCGRRGARAYGVRARDEDASLGLTLDLLPPWLVEPFRLGGEPVDADGPNGNPGRLQDSPFLRL